MTPAVKGTNASPAWSGEKPEHALDVERVEEEHREEPRARRGASRRSRRERFGPEKIDEAHERLRPSAARSRRTRRAGPTASAEDAEHLGRPPPVLCEPHDAVDEGDQAGRHRDAPATSKLLCACSSFDSGTKRSESTNVAIPTGTLTKKIHGHESASTRMPAEHEADGAAADGDRGPDAQRLRPLGALPEGRRHDRERGRRDERGAEALEAARDDQPRRSLCARPHRSEAA